MEATRFWSVVEKDFLWMYMWMVKRKDPQHHKQIRVCPPAGHAQGDSGVAAPFGGLGPIEAGEDSCDEGPLPSHTQHSEDSFDEGPLPSHMQQGVSSADNTEVPAGHPQGDSGVAAPFRRPGTIGMS
ncbi:uncharacterized protein LOC130388258 isoform X3 [Gadus chalcogrammus]|uniref:uncharacterized protein LOC130388258 isoform X3 n=1 Tax=Gadus chalcogrammus TaxID=1042646 RepID=UPI0024C4B9BB|nr:uncharacterized protein LOC130388258 isoform X3 [Gadus chalcogrammus]